MRVSLILEGPDAAELAAMMRAPRRQGGGWGWAGLLPHAAAGRALRAQQLAAEVGLDVRCVTRPEQDSSD